MLEFLDGEMSESMLEEKFSSLISEAAEAFRIQTAYATDIVLKAKVIEQRIARRK